MYKCNICWTPSRPGEPRRLHVVRRAGGQIAREIPVCQGCQADLDRGALLKDLLRVHAERRRKAGDNPPPGPANGPPTPPSSPEVVSEPSPVPQDSSIEREPVLFGYRVAPKTALPTALLPKRRGKGGTRKSLSAEKNGEPRHGKGRRK